MEDLILNPKGAAKYLCCSESFLAKLRCAGGGPEFIKVGASVAYRRSALDSWTRERSFKSTTEADARLGKVKAEADIKAHSGVVLPPAHFRDNADVTSVASASQDVNYDRQIVGH